VSAPGQVTLPNNDRCVYRYNSPEFAADPCCNHTYVYVWHSSIYFKTSFVLIYALFVHRLWVLCMHAVLFFVVCPVFCFVSFYLWSDIIIRAHIYFLMELHYFQPVAMMFCLLQYIHYRLRWTDCCMPSQTIVTINKLMSTKDGNIAAACQNPAHVKSLIIDFIEFKRIEEVGEGKLGASCYISTSHRHTHIAYHVRSFTQHRYKEASFTNTSTQTYTQTHSKYTSKKSNNTNQ